MLTLHIPSFIWEGISLKSYMIQLPVEFFYFLLFLIMLLQCCLTASTMPCKTSQQAQHGNGKDLESAAFEVRKAKWPQN